jgi:hypothetical protein
MERTVIVSREQVGVIPINSAVVQDLWGERWLSGVGDGTLHGLLIAILNVRQGILTQVARSQGESGQLPVYQNAAYAMTLPDAIGWPTVYAFGGVDGTGSDRATLFRGDPIEIEGGRIYNWKRLDVTGPAARRDAAMIFDGSGRFLILVGGRSGTAASPTALQDIWRFDTVLETWTQVATSSSFAGRYDIGLTSLGDRVFFGGGATASGSVLGDLYECETSTGVLTSYGNVLPLGGAPYLGIDEHGEGLIYAGGYYGNYWYRDLEHYTRSRSSWSSTA